MHLDDLDTGNEARVETYLAKIRAVKRVGKAYRDTVLALGGSESAYEVFRHFRGRAPTIDALLRQRGLKR